MKWLVSISVGSWLCLASSIGSSQTTSEIDPLPVPPISSLSLDGLPLAAQTHDPAQYSDIINFLKSPDLPVSPSSPLTAPAVPSRADLYPFLQNFLGSQGKNNSPSPAPTVSTSPLPTAATTPSTASNDGMDTLLALDTQRETTESPPTTSIPTTSAAPIPPAPPATPTAPVVSDLPEDKTNPPELEAPTTLPAVPPAPPSPPPTPNTSPETEKTETEDTTPAVPLPPALPTPPAPTSSTAPAPSSAPPLLKKSDLAYLKKLDMQRQALSNERTLSHATNTVLSGVEKQMLSARTAEEFSDDVSITRGKPTTDIIRNNSVATPRIAPTLSVHDAPKRSPKTSSQQIELNRASKALISGQISAAISLYKAILEDDEHNNQAIFGLATAYQRDHQDAEAHALYTKLLKRDPNNKEALNNFLLLAANEAPEDALLELKRLERINPEFSPILAQIGMIYLKMHEPAQAESYLRRALELSPGNTAYIYNLAVTLDHEGKYPEALALYNQLLEAEKDGEDVPGSFAHIQERVAYLKEKQ